MQETTADRLHRSDSNQHTDYIANDYIILSNYRPQMKLWGKVMFLHLSVILFTGGPVCLIACWDTHTPLGRPPQATPHPADTLRADTSLAKHPPGRHPPGYYGIWSTSGQYASYLNTYSLNCRFSMALIIDFKSKNTIGKKTVSLIKPLIELETCNMNKFLLRIVSQSTDYK